MTVVTGPGRVPRTVDGPAKLITLPELAKITGWDHVTLWRWAKAGKIPTVRTDKWFKVEVARLAEIPTRRAEPTMVRLPELAKITGVSRRTLSRWAAEGQISAVRSVDGCYQFDLRRVGEISAVRLRKRMVSLPELASLTGREMATLQRWSRIGRLPVDDAARFDLHRLGTVQALRS